MGDGEPKRHKPVAWLSLPELLKAGTSASIATILSNRADKRGIIASQPLSRYDLTRSPGIDDAQFVLDYLADTGDGFDATYAMARCLNGGDDLPLPPALGDNPVAADAVLWRRRAHLLMLGGDQVYPGPGSGTSEADNNYEVRLKAVFDLADDIPPKEKGAPDDPAVDAKRGYMAAIPGNHDYYDDALETFLDCFAATWGEDGIPGAAEVVTPSPNNDVVVGRYPFQSRSYFAVRLPHNWWLWGIDTQLNGRPDRHQLDYFRDFIKPEVKDEDRIIVCTARPSWVDAEGLTVDWYSARRRMGWFINRIMGNDDPPYGKPQDDWMGHVPLILSGDKHHYGRLTRAGGSHRGDETAPEHMITCGGGGAYLSSTHHLSDQVFMPWHLETGTDDNPIDDGSRGLGTAYDLQRTYPDKATSRGVLRAKFLRILTKNGPATPLLVTAIVGALTVLLTFSLTYDTPLWWAGLGVAALTVVVLLERMLHSFKPKHQPAFSLFVRKTLLLLWHAGGYLLATAVGAWVALSVASRFGLRLNLDDWKAAADTLLATEPPELVLTLAAGVAAAGLLGLLIYASYWLVSDFLGWHENELFAGMQLPGYKSFLRIVIYPPPTGPKHSSQDTAPQAGDLHLVVYGVQDVEKNRTREAGEMKASKITVIDEVSWPQRS